MNPFGKNVVKSSADFLRIKRLPVRPARDVKALVRELTEILKATKGTWTLRDVQAQALYELLETGRLFAPMGVGTGKTLITLLAPLVLDAKRPTLLLPAALIKKTEDERRELMAHWKVSTALRLLSYERLGREDAAKELELRRPDLLMADEAHLLKNETAARTRRVGRYIEANPDCVFIPLSGTMLKESLHNFAHLLVWALGDERAPIPTTTGELNEWADALDERVKPLSRYRPGVILELEKPGAPPGGSELDRARRAFHDRLVTTPGVVCSLNAEGVDASLYIKGHTYDVQRATDENFDRLRNLWETPDGWTLAEAVEVWRHARQLALGFHYIWDPRPPEEWLGARRVWAKYVRDYLSRSRTLDTEKQVRGAVERLELTEPRGEDPRTPQEILEAWLEQKPEFDVNQKAVWHDDTALKFCERWLKDGAGIVWTEHTFFARELARRTGLPYYGQGAVDDKGNAIRLAKGPIIASIAACGTGQNLQRYHRNLITSPPTGASIWEQLLGRTHRPGQTADSVEVDVLVGCLEHVTAWGRACGEAKMAEDMLGSPQKIRFADVTDMPEDAEEVAHFPGSRWKKPRDDD